ncbi:hypothetical protein ABZ756_07030 [Mammaliicoccus sciuri]
MESEKKHTEVSKEQADLVFGFLEVLFGDDVNAYWSLISKVDQARVYGMYKAGIANGSITKHYSFGEYVKEKFMYAHRERYEKVKNNPGVATHLRYTDDGEPQIFVLENVIAPRHYIAETQAKVFPVTLTVDSIVDKDDVSFNWKVRMYLDQDYKNV